MALLAIAPYCSTAQDTSEPQNAEKTTTVSAEFGAVSKPESNSKDKNTGVSTMGGMGGMKSMSGVGMMGGGGGMSAGGYGGGMAGAGYGGGMVGDIATWQFGGRKTPQLPLVVLSKSYDNQTKTTLHKQLSEDLPIMLRILEKAADIQRKSEFTAMNIRLVSMPPVQRMMYLEGYGAIFFLDVPFPLIQNQNAKDTKEAATKSNSEWEAAKREVLNQHDPFAGDLKGEYVGIPKYDEQKVSQLKKSLTESLKNVANIGQLKPDEKVTVIVQNQTSSDLNQPMMFVTAGKMKSGKVEIQEYGFKTSNVMTLSVQKRYAEEYLKGDLSEEKFAENVTVDIQ